MTDKINVLDFGYARLVDHFGDDLRIINSARASMNKESFEWTDKDAKLLKYLWDKQELSVFRHCAITFEIKAPLEVARQMYKYHVASNHTTDMDGWNEQSKRYVTDQTQFYTPTATQWRGKPENLKQGSGYPIDPRIGVLASQELAEHQQKGLELFEKWQALNVAAEQARLFLSSNSQYTTWYWTTSLAALIHFLQERLGFGAQHEIVEYAKAVKDLTAPLFPATFELIFGSEDD